MHSYLNSRLQHTSLPWAGAGVHCWGCRQSMMHLQRLCLCHVLDLCHTVHTSSLAGCVNRTDDLTLSFPMTRPGGRPDGRTGSIPVQVYESLLSCLVAILLRFPDKLKCNSLTRDELMALGYQCLRFAMLASTLSAA